MKEAENSHPRAEEAWEMVLQSLTHGVSTCQHHTTTPVLCARKVNVLGVALPSAFNRDVEAARKSAAGLKDSETNMFTPVTKNVGRSKIGSHSTRPLEK